MANEKTIYQAAKESIKKASGKFVEEEYYKFKKEREERIIENQKKKEEAAKFSYA